MVPNRIWALIWILRFAQEDDLITYLTLINLIPTRSGIQANLADQIPLAWLLAASPLSRYFESRINAL